MRGGLDREQATARSAELELGSGLSMGGGGRSAGAGRAGRRAQGGRRAGLHSACSGGGQLGLDRGRCKVGFSQPFDRADHAGRGSLE